MGPNLERSAGYSLLYRSFDHQLMKAVCVALSVSPLKDKLQRQLHRTAVSQDMRDFANAFSDFQELRHLADYDPGTVFLPSGVISLINSADAAITAFDRVAPAEQTDVLALMMVKAKG